MIGDVEREWVCRALSDHFTAGRLTPAEFDDRVDLQAGIVPVVVDGSAERLCVDPEVTDGQ